jgi:hypothetical protein
MSSYRRTEIRDIAETWEKLLEGDQRAPLFAVRFTPKGLLWLMTTANLDRIEADCEPGRAVLSSDLDAARPGS